MVISSVIVSVVENECLSDIVSVTAMTSSSSSS